MIASWVIAASAHPETVTNGTVTVEYTSGDAALARKTLDSLGEVLAEFANRLPAGSEPVRVVICSSQNEFLRFAATYTQARVTGVADSDAGLIAVKSPKMTAEGADYFGTVRHELIHVLLARNVDQDYLPRWLNEGVTMTLSREYRWESRLQIADMYLRGRIINLPDLNYTLATPGNEMEFGDAYAESLSLTRFLMDNLGDDNFWSMLLSMRHDDFFSALKKHTGWAPYEFFDAWRNSLWKLALISTLVSGFSLFQVMAILVLLAYWRKWRRGRRILARWEQEDAEGETEAPDDEFDPWDDDVDDEDDVRRW